MGKLFLTLYSLLAVAIIAFGFGVSVLPDVILEGTMARYYTDLAKGTLFLAEKALGTGTVEEQSVRLENLQKRFAYPIALRKLNEIGFDEKSKQRLDQGAVVSKRVDGAEYLYRRFRDTDLIWEVALEQTWSEHHERLTLGTFRLIEEEFQNLPQAEWSRTVAELEQHFGFPVRISSSETLNLSPSQLTRLTSDHVVVIDIGKRTEQHHYPIKDTSLVLTIGPYSEPLVLARFDLFLLGALAIVVATVVLIWVRPLWRGLVQLRMATEAFGNGDFTVRVGIPARSALTHVAQTFNAMAARIEKLISSHKELTNSVSHELRTPIARLRFGMEMVHQAADAATRTRHLQGMGADIDELDALVTELLTYARLDRDTPDVKYTQQPLGAWLSDTLDQAWRQPEGTKLEIRFDDKTNQCEAQFEPKLLARAVTNLLLNAQRYAQTRVEVNVEITEHVCRITIDDDGPGIPEADRVRIFEPFTRLDASRQRGSGGFGLGLAIVKRIAEWHQGCVDVTDSSLGGARMSLSWPIRRTN